MRRNIKQITQRDIELLLNYLIRIYKDLSITYGEDCIEIGVHILENGSWEREKIILFPFEGTISANYWLNKYDTDLYEKWRAALGIHPLVRDNPFIGEVSQWR